MNLQENIQRIKEVMGLTEGLHDTSWENEEGDKITLVDLLNVTEEIPVEKIPLDWIKPHLLSWDGDEEEVKKIKKADLQYPILILVNDDGEFISIIDGHHRAQKAIRQKLDSIDGKLIPISSLPKKFKKVFKHLQKTDEIGEEKESGEKWIKCVNCKKKFTQTIHKGKKSLPICPHCGTNNDLVIESEISVYLKRRLFDWLPKFIRNTYETLAPWSFVSLDEYMSRIIFNVVREISNSSGDLNYEEILKMRENLLPIITKYIEDNFSDEIEEYYLDNMTPG